MAYSTPTSRADGFVVDAAEWDKNTVDNPIALRTGALAIASQGANTLIYGSSASQLAALAAGTAGQILQAGAAGLPTWVGAPTNLCQGRLSLTSGTPVTNTDVTAAGTLYWALYGGNQISLYNGSAWQVFGVTELSIAVPAAANQVYDVFVDYNSGTPALALTAWTSDTTRATALTTQNGVLVLTGTLGKRYVGTVRTVTASQLNDSGLLRHVWNYYHQKPRPLVATDAGTSYTYSTATVRQFRATATNQVSIVVGVAEVPLDLTLLSEAVNDGGNSFSAGIGENSTTTYAAGAFARTSSIVPLTARLEKFPAIGYNVYSWNQWAEAVGNTTWYATETNGSTTASGLRGTILG